MNKSGLILRLTVVVIFSMLAIGLIISQVFFRITYLNEFEAGQHKIEQLYKTVSSTASIATYLEDSELVNEVISGLISNDIISGVSISTEQLKTSSDNFIDSPSTQTFALYSPFEKDRQVGSLRITPNIENIKTRADKISWDNQVAITIQSTIITFVIIIVSYVIVTQPIISIARRLHELKIGSDERISLPAFHNKSEIGLLVGDINVLLDRTTNQISEERILRMQVEKLSRHFKLLFENANSPIVLSEPNGDIILYNRSFSDILSRLNIPLKQNFGPYLRELFNNKTELDQVIETAFNNNEIASGEFKLDYLDNKQAVWVQTIISSTITEDYREYYQITLHDISLRKKELEQLDQQAHTDDLTQLVNRRGAEQQIKRLIHQQVPFAILLLDLNKFKPINDIYGHDVGDEILSYVSTQFTLCLRKRDLLARWGGDEFVIVLPNIDKKETKNVCKKIIQNIEKPYQASNIDHQLSVSASIGASFYPNDKVTLEELIKTADKAMYQCKEINKVTPNTSVIFYDDIT